MAGGNRWRVCLTTGRPGQRAQPSKSKPTHVRPKPNTFILSLACTLPCLNNEQMLHAPPQQQLQRRFGSSSSSGRQVAAAAASASASARRCCARSGASAAPRSLSVTRSMTNGNNLPSVATSSMEAAVPSQTVAGEEEREHRHQLEPHHGSAALQMFPARYTKGERDACNHSR